LTVKEFYLILQSDLRGHGISGVRRVILGFFFNMSLRLVLNYRLGAFLAARRNNIASIIILYLKKRQIKNYGCDISYHATIGLNIRFPHPLNIVIGDKVIIEDNNMIWQGVTIGSHGKKGEIMEYPRIKNRVKIYAGAKVLGGITIGDDAIVGANAVVLKNVPNKAIAMGVPSINKMA
jgi:serine O-acetyltransferase